MHKDLFSISYALKFVQYGEEFKWKLKKNSHDLCPLICINLGQSCNDCASNLIIVDDDEMVHQTTG